MRYVLRVDHDGKVLLHNVVTGQLVILEQREIEVVNSLPLKYDPGMEQLVVDHFLVPEEYDEHQQALNLRSILRRIENAHSSKVITHYTILPTTACNARCYYCFEHGIKHVTMQDETVNDVISYISSHCGNTKQVSLTWFGGEPTVAINQIDKICTALREQGIVYSSQMITNGYLFDETIVERAKKLWNLYSVQISVDGTENRYNYIKSYVNACDNPYKKVMYNIGLLLANEIKVNLRMNFDIDNYGDFEKLVGEIALLYGGNRFINVRAHPINGEYPDKDGMVHHGTESWFTTKVVELNNYADAAGLFKKKGELPSLRYSSCMAASDASVTITPDGHIVNCPEHVDKEYYTGNLHDGITEPGIVASWKEIADYERCAECFMYPYCIRATRCSAKDSCSYRLLYIQQFTNAIVEQMKKID